MRHVSPFRWIDVPAEAGSALSKSKQRTISRASQFLIMQSLAKLTALGGCERLYTESSRKIRPYTGADSDALIVVIDQMRIKEIRRDSRGSASRHSAQLEERCPSDLGF